MATWTSSPPCADRLKVPRGELFGPVRSLHVSVRRDRTPSEFLAGPSARRVRDLVTLVSSKFPAGNFWTSPLYKRFRLVVLERPRHARVGAVHRESGPCSFEIVRKFPAGNFGSADLTGRAVTLEYAALQKFPAGNFSVKATVETLMARRQRFAVWLGGLWNGVGSLSYAEFAR